MVFQLEFFYDFRILDQVLYVNSTLHFLDMFLNGQPLFFRFTRYFKKKLPIIRFSSKFSCFCKLMEMDA